MEQIGLRFLALTFSLLIATPALGQVTQCITISSAKAQKVNDARQLYNARTGQSLTVEEYVLQIVRRAVVDELTQQTEATEQAAIDAAEAAKQQAVLDAADAISQTRQSEDQGWP